MTSGPQLAVVGGGIAGLAAAYHATELLPGAGVILHEAADRLGGKIRTTPFAGLPVDEAADAFLGRVPWGVDLATRLGLEARFISPATGAALVWLEDRLVPLPQPHVMGVPTDPGALERSGVVSSSGVEALRRDLARTVDPHEGAESVAAMVRRRLGDELLSKFIAPLVGSVYASDCEKLDLETGSPQLAKAAAADASLVRGMQQLSSGASTNPVFYSIEGGMGQLIAALGATLGDRVRLNSEVTSLTQGPIAGSDGIILACPAGQAARLVADVSPEAASLLASIEYASVSLLTLAYEPNQIPAPLEASGFLVPRKSDLTITACSYASTKWSQLGGGPAILRASVGSHGADEAAGLDDEALIEAVTADLQTTLGVSAPPQEIRISRWSQSFPQYQVGHGGLVSEIEHLLHPHGIYPVGAPYRGIGIPACINQGQLAVGQFSEDMESRAD